MSNLEKYLKQTGKQKEVEERQIEIRRNPKLDEICRDYETWLGDLRNGLDKDYERALEFSRREYSAEDIEGFSLELKRFEDKRGFEKSGLFLSALTNHSKRKRFVIITEHLSKKISFIGYKNEKVVEVRGNAGDEVGQLNRGKISVSGNAGNEVGRNNSVEISVGGNAGNWVGLNNSGKISVGGNAGDWVGLNNSGEISVSGDAGNKVGDNNSGEIDIKGKINSLHGNASGEIYSEGRRI